MKRLRLLLLLMAMAVLVFSSTAFAESKFPSKEELSNATFAVLTGTTAGPETEKSFPGARIEYYNTSSDLLAALRSGKADAAVHDVGILRHLQTENRDLVIDEHVLREIYLAPAFPKTDKGKALCEEYSAFVKKCKEDGTLKEIDSIWFGSDESKQQIAIDYDVFPQSLKTDYRDRNCSAPLSSYASQQFIDSHLKII